MAGGSGGGYGEADLLASCYRESLRLAAEPEPQSIAFPCISTGVFLYPPKAVCDIAVSAVVEWLAKRAVPQMVTLCCFSPKVANLYRVLLGRQGFKANRTRLRSHLGLSS